MTDQLSEHLQFLNSLEVNDASGIIFYSFNEFADRHSKIPLVEIDLWLDKINEPKIKAIWADQKKRSWPLHFLTTMFEYYKRDIVQKREYLRLKSKEIQTDYISQKMKVTKHILSLSFEEGIQYLGKLAGVWMLTYPEAQIFEIKPERHKPWEDIFLGSQALAFEEKELRILFTLDCALYFSQFEFWDEHNT